MATEKRPLGVLILHGFTGSLDTVRPVAPIAEKLGLPWRMPLLRGHGTRFEDLVDVTAEAWVEDAKASLDALLEEVERVVVVGLSMGGLVSLTLAIEHPQHIAGVVVLAPALRFASPLTHLTPLLKLLFTFWDSPPSFHDLELAAKGTNYKRFPTATFERLMRFGREVENRLGAVTVPVTLLFSRKDQIVHGGVPAILERGLGGRLVRTVYFERSGHEMFQDNEAEAVAAAVEAELVRYRDAAVSSPR